MAPRSSDSKFTLLGLTVLREPMDSSLPSPPNSLVQRYRSLLDVTEAIVSDRDLPELFHDLAVRLQGVLTFDSLYLVLHDPADETMHLHVWESSAGRPLPVRDPLPVEDAPSVWVL